MNIEIKLSSELWYKEENCYAKGHLFYKCVLYEEEDLVSLFKGINSKQELDKLLVNSQGYFTAILYISDQVYLVSDRIRSYPMFYSRSKTKKNYITDSPYNILDGNIKFNELSLKEIQLTGYVTGKDTIFNDIYQTRAGRYLIFTEGNEFQEHVYTQFPLECNYLHDKEELIKQMNKAYSSSMERTIKYLKGRQVVIPLSGGLDSRLLLALLKEYEYDNIITFTYGKKEKDEVLTSKMVAEFFKVKWVCIPYKNKPMKKLYNGNRYNEMAEMCSLAASLPHIQDWYAIEYLKNNNFIDHNAVMIPGHTVTSIVELAPEELEQKLIFDSDDILKMIIKSNYVYNKQLWDQASLDIKNKLKACYGLTSDELYKTDAYKVLCNFGYNERQTKYTVNSIRIYEFLNYEWYLPFWDKDIMNIWSKVPQELSYHREIYYDFINYKYKELQDLIPVFGHDTEVSRSKKKASLMDIIKKNIGECRKVISAIKRRYFYYMNLDGYTNWYQFYSSLIHKRYNYVEMWSYRYVRTQRKNVKMSVGENRGKV